MEKQSSQPIFDAFYVIGIKDHIPFIKFQYPTNIHDESISKNVPHFCFPGWEGDDVKNNERYCTFILLLKVSPIHLQCN